MIKSEELMIGNYIESYGEISEITLIGTEGVSAKYDVENGKCTVRFSNPNLLPIPLTEEWLIKFGFDKSFDSSFYILILPHKYKVYISISFEMYSYQVCQSGNGFSVDIKHVHQLQNLYYVLTGEQLTIKKQ